MTQALALAGILREAGHRVSAVLIGESSRRRTPQFFLEKIGASVEGFSSPNFATDAAERSIRMKRTLIDVVRHEDEYRASLSTIGRSIARFMPDLVVNFYEPMAGIFFKLRRPNVPLVCIAHQYLVHHPAYPFPERSFANQLCLKLFTDVTSMSANRRLALSFYPTTDIPSRATYVVPPLLRPEVFELAPTRSEPFLLSYILNSGYADQIMRWHEANPDTALHCFWNNPAHPESYEPHPNLTFHQLHGQKFLELMARCRGLICTAGFESVCEAMYLGKPVMMVPVEGHFEQACNALDATKAGAGIALDRFEIDAFMKYLSGGSKRAQPFRGWAESAPDLFVRHIETAARRTVIRPVITHSRQIPLPQT